MATENELNFWKEGHEAGSESVFAFLDEITFIDAKKLKKHYNLWCNADSYTTLDGKKIDRCK